MIEFVSLFLALTIGPQPIAVSVGQSVSAVELLLDGAKVATLEGPPWQTEYDFGFEVLPRELVAVARDSSGAELGRVRQLINVPRQRSEARLALESDDDSRETTARLIWRALDRDRPRSIAMTFDGRPLTVTDPERIRLPKFDPKTLHLLRAELEFSDTEQAFAELVFGGSFGARVATELTAIPVTVTRGRLPKPEDMAGWFSLEGQPLDVVAIERTTRDILVVREKSATNLEGLKALIRLATSSRVRLAASVPKALQVGDRLRFVFPTAVSRDSAEGQLEMMPASGDVAKLFRGAGLFPILTDVFFPDQDIPVPSQSLTDAVAIAGLVAAASSRSRVVLLVATGEGEDRSLLDPQQVRAYFDALRVPLRVWTPVKLEPTALERLSAWGEVQSIHEVGRAAQAIRQLDEELDQQAMVWVEGSHLPQRIEITEQARNIEAVR